jgi:meiotic recombination protein SPO11
MDATFGNIQQILKRLMLYFMEELSQRRIAMLRDSTDEGHAELRLNSATYKSYVGVIALAGIMARLNLEGQTITQRDVYYALKFLFNNQNECNKMIIRTGKVLKLRRHEMRIVPGTRGCVAGDLKFSLKSEGNVWFDCENMASQGGFPISNIWTLPGDDIEIQTKALFLLVIEKEGIYRRLCEDEFTRFRCILVTGCGYPDVATRALVHRLSQMLPHITVLGICDFNPHGIALLLTYKFGSKSMNFESEGFEVSRLKWLGLRMKQLEEMNLDDICYERLSEHDHRKIDWLLEKQEVSKEYKIEIRKWLEWDRKCDLESLYSLGIGVLSTFLENAIKNFDYI